VSVAPPDVTTRGSAARRRFVIEADSPDEGAHVDPSRAAELTARLRGVWHRALCALRDKSVAYACLPALGCEAEGAAAEVCDLARHSAAALRACLAARRPAGEAYGFRGVVVACPVFSYADRRAYDQFRTALRRRGHELCAPVLVTRAHAGLDVADHLARTPPTASVGLVVAADAAGVRAGYLGMHFDGARTGPTELVALRTTLLAGHVGFDPEPWRGAAGRCVFVDRRGGADDT
jgi:hypothetical protein